jgi:hypothetical protein
MNHPMMRMTAWNATPSTSTSGRAAAPICRSATPSRTAKNTIGHGRDRVRDHLQERRLQERTQRQIDAGRWSAGRDRAQEELGVAQGAARPRLEDVHEDQARDHRERHRDQVQGDGSRAQAADVARAAHPADRVRDREQNHGRDHHLEQGDEDAADDARILDAAARPGAEHGAQHHADQDLRVERRAAPRAEQAEAGEQGDLGERGAVGREQARVERHANPQGDARSAPDHRARSIAACAC